MKKKFYIKTWGCQMNEYDSELIINKLKNKNFIFTQDFYEADILILNTCSIREKAQEKVFHQLGRWKKLKEKNPNIIIAVGGCVANQEGKYMYQRANYINIIFGTQTLYKLPEMIEFAFFSKKLIIDISLKKIKKFNSNYISHHKKIPVTAFVSIMEGCNNCCSFCIVPYTRGHEISRPVQNIISEIINLSQHGTREINLLGQNVNSYKGIGPNGKLHNFSDLIQIVSKIDKIDRIRFITSNPFEFTDDVIELYSTIPKLVSFLHLPIQSGSNKILKLMRRKHTTEEYKNITKKLTQARHDIQISSDFIVGFPGETEKDFLKTIKIIEDVNFDMSFSFIYSKRPGTPASKLIDNVSLDQKKERLYFLQKKINDQTLNWSKLMLNKEELVLVEKKSKKNFSELMGRTENNRIVYFQGTKELIGKFIKIKITSVSTHVLYGFIKNNKIY